MPLTPEQYRLLNTWNTTRHAWNRYQAGNRRAALRIAHKPLNDDFSNTAQTSTTR
ncbi:hypothetical protein [Streptomyces sp. PU_AKi4]|uniref:hypothetical protein n=1 Tax=Streptomyces sp. PU_AKi4 TaxID=2800809 RepID=UPI003523C2CF